MLSASKTSIHVSWASSRSAVPVAGFRIYVNGSLRASVRGNSYRVGGLRCGTSYLVAVGSYDDRGHRSNLRSRRVSTVQCGGPCFASPGSCGYPDPAFHNVGVPQGTQLTPSRSLDITKNGTVINGLDITGSVSIEATNVTIENTRINCGCEDVRGFAIHENNYAGLTIKNVEINGGELYVTDATLDHVYMHDCGECVQYANTVKDSYILVNAVPTGGSHYEATYNNHGTLDVEHSTFLNPHEQTATIFMDIDNHAPCDAHLTVNNSLLAGGGYLIYPCAEASSAGSSQVALTNNRFARCTTTPVVNSASGYICQGYGSPNGDGDVLGNPDGHGYYPYGGFFGDVASVYCVQTTWSNNVWDDNGATDSCR